MIHQTSQFELSPRGYEQAIRWLTKNGHSNHIDTYSKPMDCYSVVTLANELLVKSIREVKGVLNG